MNRIAMSPLTGRIYSGRTNKAGDTWIGEKKDVTSDVLKALIDKAEYHGGSFEIEASSSAKWVVTIEKAAV